ncbi:MAG: T9SS type A sorting domain-containing protein [Calditrichaeota bacterium]|nr:T9SS type A sorting domain-containing protein [Calditrichota bacterium]MCB9391767.1 T9SS type A sorting domain-containing protein [Calditrichota bacterium]
MHRFSYIALTTLLLVSQIFASPSHRGYSGAPGSLGRCSSSCHGVGVGTVQVTGFPEDYVPDSTYLISIAALSGQSIKNFNGSVRAGLGSTTAGTITAGQGTATYSVSQETNGVRLAQIDQQSATFSWTAPASGTGTVRLYVAAHQGARNTGPNTNITLIANEAVLPNPPEPPSDPLPPTLATGVPLSTTLWWWEDPATDYCEVYFGTENPPALLDGNVADDRYTLADLAPNTTFYWQVYAVNAGGSTPGPIWSFTTEAESPAHDAILPTQFSVGDAYPNPFNPLVRIDLSVPVSSPLTARIYDRTGRLVTTLADNLDAFGQVQLEWNASGHSAGLYFLQCDCNGLTVTQKLVFLP